LVVGIAGPKAVVQNFLQVLDIIFRIGQNKNTLIRSEQGLVKKIVTG